MSPPPHRIAELVDRAPLSELGPGRNDRQFREMLAALLEPGNAGAAPADNSPMARCCQAGLWLAYNFLDESHRISQEIETPEGSYWHGIMHRREPDFANSKYWFHRVGEHSIHAALRDGAEALAIAAGAKLPAAAEFLAKQPRWGADRFVDLCEMASRKTLAPENDAIALLCRRVADLEWRLLFGYCRERA